MSSTYHQYIYLLHRLLRDIQTQKLLTRSRLQHQQTQSILHRSYLDEASLSLRQIHLHSQLQGQQFKVPPSPIQRTTHPQQLSDDLLIKRLRMQTDIETDRLGRQAILRRSRLEMEIRNDTVSRHLEKSRLESQLQKARLDNKKDLEDVMRRSRVDRNCNLMLSRNRGW